jgi:hypothetical protein
MGKVEMRAPNQPSAERAELAAVLSSELFRKAPNLARLLEYICTKYFEGSAGDLKEYNIGVEALGRPSDFDPTTTSIVRVEIHRLRERLKKYYETEGSDHPLAITLQVGHYVPHFLPRANGVGEAVAAGNGASESGLVAAASAGGQAAENAMPSSAPLPATLDSEARVSMLQPGNDQAKIRRAFRPFILLMTAGVVAAVAVAAWLLSRPGPVASPSTVPVSSGGMAPIVEQNEIRILAGYFKDQYIGSGGKLWQGDRYFDGGSAETRNLRYIARTSDPILFHTLRQGEFSYRIPLQPGVYEVRLFFAETFFGPDTYAGGGEASRVFTLTINGKPAIEEMDPYRDAGGNNVAEVRVFKDISPGPDGFLDLGFNKVRDDPFINAIEIIPGTPGKLHPIRIVAQQNTYTDHLGQLWDPDRYFSGGQLVARKVAIEGADDAGLYSGERYGHFSYAIPVADGVYAVTLRFAETYFGAKNVGFGGMGSRLFDVYCNGMALLRDFDIYKEAGGANRAVVRTFAGLRPNGLGKLEISFVPSKNYALVNAIEVIDQSR